jgi:hypothetical protein
MKVAHIVLLSLGANEVPIDDTKDDPQTEEEFQTISYVSPTPITWTDYQSKYNQVLEKITLRQLRAERDRLLKETDWVMTVDSYQTLVNKEEWVTYRQALRNLPANPPVFIWNNGSLDFTQMSMPVKPEIIRNTSV